MNNTSKITSLLEENPAQTVNIHSSHEFCIKAHDEPQVMTWHDAMQKFGTEGSDKEWRLPTRFELLTMFEQKDKIPNIDTGKYYWSSTEGSNSSAWYQRFSDGYQYDYGTKNGNYLVRCVRR